MKKTAFVLVMAAILAFAFAATAMADTTSGMITWNAAAPNNAPATPHKGYAYNTQKCLVCHAVHKASATGEVLLGATVANACNYCHVSTNTISSKHVYNNDPLTFASDTEFNHSNGCTTCHAVHGAGTVNMPTLSAKILKDPTLSTNYQIETLPVAWNVSSSGADRAGALSAFCTMCHPYYTGTYALQGAGGNVNGSTGVGGPYNSHIMTSDFAAYAPGSDVSVPSTTQVAYASSAYCTSCHDAGTAGSVSDNFPHLTTGARFMKSSDYVNDATTPAASATEDGVCLKCHVGTGGLVGVGIGF